MKPLAARYSWGLAGLVLAASCSKSSVPSTGTGGESASAGAVADGGAAGSAWSGAPNAGDTTSHGGASGGSAGIGGRPTTGSAGEPSLGGQGSAGDDGDGGELAVDPFPYQGCVLEGRDPTVIAGEGGAGGAPEEGPRPALDEDCEPWGKLGCSASPESASLVCDQGTWKLFAKCESGQGCDARFGICVDVQPECAEHGAGYTSCEGDDLLRCADNLVEQTRSSCCGVCKAGQCEVPSCGDGKVTGYESCDDGNRVAGDGCEPDCQRSAVVALAGGGSHTCALLRGGAVRCWGDNRYGQLGLGTKADLTTQRPYELPVVALDAAATALASGNDHTCALLRSGAVRCWGRNQHGQLGLGHTQNIGDDETPDEESSRVALGAKSVAIAAGGDETCVVMQGGSVRCWGVNQFGQLGLGHTQNIGDDEQPSSALAQLSLGGVSVSVAVASEHACALFDSGLIRCWGHNDVGQLGLGHTRNIGDDEAPSTADPIDFRTLEDPSLFSLSAGGQRACVGLSQGFMQGWMYCWGYNGDGGLGVGLVENRPQQKAGQWGLFSWGSPSELIVVGAAHQCVQLYNHDLHCWGLNDKAQLGLPHLETMGDSENVTLFPPSKFPSGSYPVTTTAGAFHTCVVLDTGKVLCWGRNAHGELGIGRVSPAPNDFVGGDAQHTPDELTPTLVLPPSP